MQFYYLLTGEYSPKLGMDHFHFFEYIRYNNRFVIKTKTKKQKTKRSFSKTIVIRFLKVQNEWVVLKNDRFFSKKRLTTLPKTKDPAVLYFSLRIKDC